MEHLLEWSKCFIFHNIFKYMIFKKVSKGVIMEKRVKCSNDSQVDYSAITLKIAKLHRTLAFLSEIWLYTGKR